MTVLFDLTEGSGWVRTTVANTTSNTQVVAVMPSGVVAGDLIIAVIQNIASANPGSIGVPEGWNIAFTNTPDNGNFRVFHSIAWVIAGPEEPASYTFDVSVSVADDSVTLFRVEAGSFDPESPIDALGTDYNENQTTFATPALTTVTPNAVVLWAIGTKDGNVFNDGAYPGGTTGVYKRASRAHSNGINSGFATQLVTDVGNTGNAVWTNFNSAARYGTCVGIAIKPAGGSSGASITSITSPAFTTVVADMDNPVPIDAIYIVVDEIYRVLQLSWLSAPLAPDDERFTINLDRNNLPFVGIIGFEFEQEESVAATSSTLLFTESGTQASVVESADVVNGIAGLVELDPFEDGDQYQTRHVVPGLILTLNSDTTIDSNLPPPFDIEVRTWDKSTNVTSTWRTVHIVEPSEPIEGAGGLHRLGFRFGF